MCGRFLHNRISHGSRLPNRTSAFADKKGEYKNVRVEGDVGVVKERRVEGRLVTKGKREFKVKQKLHEEVKAESLACRHANTLNRIVPLFCH